MSKQNSKSPNFWLAIGLIALGVLFLLDNFDVMEIGSLWRFWPVLLIAVGVLRLIGANFQDKASASFLIGLGTLFLLLDFDILEWESVWKFWPVILILIGGSIIYRRSGKYKAGEISENRVDVIAFFGGNDKKISASQFEGGNMTAIFGGAKLDFSGTTLSQSDNVLDVFAMFGGAEICVPKDWFVVIKGFPIFGGFEDARANVPAGEGPPNKTLIIKGFVMFGGLEVKTT